MKNNKGMSFYETFLIAFLTILIAFFKVFLSDTWVWRVSPFIFTPVFLIIIFLFTIGRNLFKKYDTLTKNFLAIALSYSLLMVGFLGSSHLFQNVPIEKIRTKQKEFIADPLYQADLHKIDFGTGNLTSAEQEIHRKVLLEVTGEKTKSRVVSQLMNKQKRLREMDKNMGDYIEKRVPLFEALLKEWS